MESLILIYNCTLIYIFIIGSFHFYFLEYNLLLFYVIIIYNNRYNDYVVIKVYNYTYMLYNYYVVPTG